MSVRLQQALDFAVKAHAGQDRDGDSPPPYACHPVEVMLNLRYTGRVDDEDLLIVALLHDVLEMTPTKPAQIEKLFGVRVRTLVEQLTREEPDASALAGLGKDELWKLRAGMLLAEIERMGPDAQKVKLADRLSNLREARIAKSPAKYRRYEAQSRRILELVPRKRNPGLWDAIKAELGAKPTK